MTTWLKGPAVAPPALAGAGGAGAGAGGGAAVPDAEAQAAAKAAAAAASAAEKAEAQAKKEAKQARHRAAGAWEGGMCSTALPRSRPPPPTPPTHHPTPVFARHIESEARRKRRNERSFGDTHQMASYLRMSLLDKNVEAQNFVRCHQDACRDKLTSAIAAAQMAEMAEPLDESGVDSGAE